MRKRWWIWCRKENILNLNRTHYIHRQRSVSVTYSWLSHLGEKKSWVGKIPASNYGTAPACSMWHPLVTQAHTCDNIQIQICTYECFPKIQNMFADGDNTSKHTHTQHQIQIQTHSKLKYYHGTAVSKIPSPNTHNYTQTQTQINTTPIK